VASAQESIELCATPAGHQLEPNLERIGYLPQHAEGHLWDLT
jgi:hypothetical protein